MSIPERDFGKPLKYSTVNDILEYRSEHQEDDPYILYGPEERHVSYGEMNETANAFGNRLLNAGVKKQDKIALMMEHQLETIFSFHGILKAGAIYAPIHNEYKGDNLIYQINDTNPEFLIIEDRYVTRLNEVREELDRLPTIVVRETGDDVELLDDDFESIPYEEFFTGSEENPGVLVGWDDIACIIYTSGTTGKPKGVLQSHRHALCGFGDVKATFLSAGDVVHTNLPLFHVAGLHLNILGAMISGATVAAWDKFSSTEFWDRAEKYQVSNVTLISSMIPWLMNQEESPTDHHNTINKAQFIPLVDNYKAVADRFGFDIVNTNFGQTESGIPIVGTVVAAEEEQRTPDEFQRGKTVEEVMQSAKAKGIPIIEGEVPGENWVGQPPENSKAEVTILDKQDEKLPPGETGELAIRPIEPHMIFKEYLSSPAKTVEAWQNLWFHSGDALRRDEEGNYYFVDRIGDVIRHRGENISTTQVENSAMKHESVDQVACFPVPARDGEEDDVAIAVELAEEADFDEDAFREFLREELPEFMIPNYVKVIDEMPTTETAKIEKYKLRSRLIEEESLLDR